MMWERRGAVGGPRCSAEAVRCAETQRRGEKTAGVVDSALQAEHGRDCRNSSEAHQLR